MRSRLHELLSRIFEYFSNHYVTDLRHSREVVEALLGAGIPVDVKDTGWFARGATPLMNLGISGRVDLGEMLLERGADVNASFTAGPLFGVTPLMWASLNGHAALVSRLLDAGARVNASKCVCARCCSDEWIWHIILSYTRIHISINLLPIDAAFLF